MAELSGYEKRALRQIREYKDRSVARQFKQMVPDPVKRRVTAGGAKAKEVAGRVPGLTKAAEAAGVGYSRAAEGLSKGLGKTATMTLSEPRVIKAFGKRGYPVECLADIRSLDLEVIEKHVRPRAFDHYYAVASSVEGAAASLMITGGELLATAGGLAGAGAGAAPGAGTVAAVMAGDAAAVLTVCTRVVHHTALYYGYDPAEPAEAMYALGVMNLGSAVTNGGRYAAFAELSQITQQLVRSATWRELNGHLLVRILDRFARMFGVRLTKAKLGQMVPFVGVAAGAGLNYWLVNQVAEAAYWSYRERFLNDKQGGAEPYLPREPERHGEKEENIDINSIVEDVLADDIGLGANMTTPARMEG